MVSQVTGLYPINRPRDSSSSSWGYLPSYELTHASAVYSDSRCGHYALRMPFSLSSRKLCIMRCLTLTLYRFRLDDLYHTVVVVITIVIILFHPWSVPAGGTRDRALSAVKKQLSRGLCRFAVLIFALSLRWLAYCTGSIYLLYHNRSEKTFLSCSLFQIMSLWPWAGPSRATSAIRPRT